MKGVACEAAGVTMRLKKSRRMGLTGKLRLRELQLLAHATLWSLSLHIQELGQSLRLNK